MSQVVVFLLVGIKSLQHGISHNAAFPVSEKGYFCASVCKGCECDYNFQILISLSLICLLQDRVAIDAAVPLIFPFFSYLFIGVEQKMDGKTDFLFWKNPERFTSLHLNSSPL